MKFINEEFKYDNLDWEKRTKIFNIFKASYEEAVGTSWSEDKFRQRASNWLFFGDENGFVTVRPQQSGFYKLTGVAGGIKSIMKGLAELKAANLPIWGMATKELTNILVGRYGFKTPNKIESMVLMKMIPTNVFGGVEYKKNSDGSITFQYPDVGESTKFFVGNDAYYKKIKQQLGAKLNPFNLLKEDDEEVLDEKRAVERETQSSIDVIKSYIKKYGVNNVYVSFRESVHTSTINPNNRYNTPTGFYAYPIKYYVENRRINMEKTTWQYFVNAFPFAQEREFVNIFSISDDSRILFTSQDSSSSSKIQHYIEQIRSKYGRLFSYVESDSIEDYDNFVQPTQKSISQSCDEFLSGNWKSTYLDDDDIDGNRFPDNQLAQFWLFLYYVAELIRVGGRLNNKISIIAKEIGLLGICDDAGLGMIHMNERAQIVLFYGFMNIISDYRVISSKAQRQDMPLPIDVNRNSDGDSAQTKMMKVIKFMGAKMKQYLLSPTDYYSDDEAIKALESVKNNLPFTVRIKREVDGVDRYLPFYINKEGEITTGNNKYDDIYGDNSSTERAAFMNTNNPNNAKFLQIREPNDMGYSHATMYSNSGDIFDGFINKEGVPELPEEFDFMYQSYTNILAYLNTIAGYKKWSRVVEFIFDNGEHSLGWLNDEKYSKYPVVIDKQGNIVENGFNSPISEKFGYNTVAAQLNTVSNLAKFNGNYINSHTIDNGKLFVEYRSRQRQVNLFGCFDLYGHPSVKGLNPDDMENGKKIAGYYNTLKNVELFTNVIKLSDDSSVFIGTTMQFMVDGYYGYSFYVDKLTVNPSLEGIVEGQPFYIKETYDFTKKLIEKGLTVEEINNLIPSDGTPPMPFPANDIKESLLDAISEALENLLTI